MAASMTFTYDDAAAIKKIIVAWTSAAGGGVAGTTKKITGSLIKGVTDPDGTAVPTDDYDIVITDPEGVNVLGNAQDDLVDRDTANTEEVYFELTTVGYPVVCDKLTITVAAAGDTKSGQLILYYRAA